MIYTVTVHYFGGWTEFHVVTSDGEKAAKEDVWNMLASSGQADNVDYMEADLS